MSDIMKFIVEGDRPQEDPEGHLHDLEEWSEERAKSLADFLSAKVNQEKKKF